MVHGTHELVWRVDCLDDGCRYRRGQPSRRLIDFFFFFQAEDGIRDLTVTGVQTCALPIYCHAGRMRELVTGADHETRKRVLGIQVYHPPLTPGLRAPHRRRLWRRLATLRSEERRVGKEWRSRWSPYH